MADVPLPTWNGRAAKTSAARGMVISAGSRPQVPKPAGLAKP